MVKRKLYWRKGTAIFLAVILTVGLSSVTAEDSGVYAAQETEQTGDNEYASGYHNMSYPLESAEKSGQSSNSKTSRLAMPASYDARTRNCITDVKNQGTYGTCWAFAAINSAESDGIIDGLLNRDDADLSEAQLAYFFYHRISDPLGGTRGDKVSVPSSNDYLAAGGNHQFSTFALSSWISPARETVMPYENMGAYTDSNVTENMAYLSGFAHLQNANWVSMSDITSIKAMVQRYGSVATSFYSLSNYYQYKNNDCYYYYPFTVSQNHAVSIVGWDDSIPKENFSVTVGSLMYTPQNDGAWLIKNSYGSDFGNSGYFWIPYEDIGLLSKDNVGVAFDFESADNYDYNHQYDGTVSLQRLQYNGYTSCYNANVFTTQTTEDLKAVGFYTTQPGMGYEIQIYRNVEEDSPMGTAVLEEPVTGTADYAGYHTIALPENVELAKGESFSVVVKYLTSGTTVTFFIDKSVDYNWINCESSNKPGQGYYSLNGDMWKDCSTVQSANIRIKAFTDYRRETEVDSVELSVDVPTAGTALAENGSCSTEGVSPSIPVTWEKKTKSGTYDVVTGMAGYYTTYRASVTLGTERTSETKYVFPDYVAVKVNGNSVANERIIHNGDGTLTVWYEFPATAKRKIVSVAAPEIPDNHTFLNYYTGETVLINGSNRELGTQAKVTLEGSVEPKEVPMNVTWSLVGTYHAEPEADNTFQWTVVPSDYEEYDVESDSIKMEGTVAITNREASPVKIEETDKSKQMEYTRKPIDVSQYFELDVNAGAPSYTLVAEESTGEGIIDGTNLTVTKPGIYIIKVNTAATGNYLPGEKSVTLTVGQKTLIPVVQGSVSKIYDGTTKVSGGLMIKLEGVEDSDDVTASAFYSFDNADVGEKKTVTASNIILSGEDAGKYKLSATSLSANVGTIIKPAEEETNKTEEETTTKQEETNTKSTEKVTGAKQPVKKGTILTDTKTKAKYQVISSDNNSPTVAFKNSTDKKAKVIQVPKAVTINGITYQVVSILTNACKNHRQVTKIIVGSNVKKIGKYAFKNCKKLKKIEIKSKKLTSKTISKKAFTGVSKKVVITVPKNKRKSYIKLFRKRGMNKKIKVK